VYDSIETSSWSLYLTIYCQLDPYILIANYQFDHYTYSTTFYQFSL